MNRIRNVICGVSGGVDSAVSAYLLKKKGFSVTGVFMTNWDPLDEGATCSLNKDKEDAHYVCRHLGIPFKEVNFVKEYWNEVFERVVGFYERGMTPNPDILCNKYIKFDAFANYALKRVDADAFATGHYARTTYGAFLEHRDATGKECRLLRSADPVKDQTFWLSQVSSLSLQRAMFPVGVLLKPEVKAIARDIGLERIANRNESMGICFIGKRKFTEFIDQYIPQRPGVFRNIETGKVLARHKGIHHYTLGQRIPISGMLGPLFAAHFDPSSQEIGVVLGTDHPALYMRSMVTDPAHWIGQPISGLLENGHARCGFVWQNKWRTIDCEVQLMENGQLHVTLECPMRAVDPGQYAVFYDGDVCLGSALIVKSTSLYAENHHESVKWSCDDFLLEYKK